MPTNTRMARVPASVEGLIRSMRPVNLRSVAVSQVDGHAGLQFGNVGGGTSACNSIRGPTTVTRGSIEGQFSRAVAWRRFLKAEPLRRSPSARSGPWQPRLRGPQFLSRLRARIRHCRGVLRDEFCLRSFCYLVGLFGHSQLGRADCSCPALEHPGIQVGCVTRKIPACTASPSRT